MFISTWFKNLLETLEIESYLFYLIVLFIAILSLYFMLKPVITWIVSLKSTRLLTYLLSSLITMLCLFVISIFIDQPFDSAIFRTLLQAISLFGIVLALFYSILRVTKRS
ncbi:hypothetical protein CUC15_08400 [Oceanobacillus zhaokaii]|uniref:Uncharacterized protein n=1 Tax=Oceanobacillus zhaokaii TaxID=2052660 RepID=A0A345PG04_9BACI|nr:hypothetical protein CUC15_08400 [Oceanobacillus zhaokaii]